MMKVCVRSVAAAAFALSALVAGHGRAAGADYGTVTGQFVLKGPLPVLAPLVVNGQNVKDAAVCAAQAIPDESLIVDPETRGIANVFVWMPNAPAKIAPELEKTPTEIKFGQKGCRFMPHALILRTNQTVAVTSDDPIPHNTHVYTINNTGQNSTISAMDRVGVKWTFPLPERIPSTVKCDIHGWMEARWLIIDHPYAALSGKDGKFKIEMVPAGEQTFIAWQEGKGWVFGISKDKRTRKVQVKANAVTDLGTIEIPAAVFLKK